MLQSSWRYGHIAAKLKIAAIEGMDDFKFCDEKALSLLQFNLIGLLSGVFACVVAKLL